MAVPTPLALDGLLNGDPILLGIPNTKNHGTEAFLAVSVQVSDNQSLTPSI